MLRQHRPKLGGGIRPSKTPGWGGGLRKLRMQRHVLYLSDAFVISASAPVHSLIISAVWSMSEIGFLRGGEAELEREFHFSNSASPLSDIGSQA